jgi:hypothetical protein
LWQNPTSIEKKPPKNLCQKPTSISSKNVGFCWMDKAQKAGFETLAQFRNEGKAN